MGKSITALLTYGRRHELLNSIASPSGSVKTQSPAAPGVPGMTPVFDSQAVDRETLYSALSTFTEFFRNIRIATRRRSVLERASRDGLTGPPESSETPPAFMTGTPIYRLLSENTSSQSLEANRTDQDDCCRLAILLYVCTGVLKYHDKPAVTKSFLDWLSALADFHDLDDHANPELILCALVEENSDMMRERGDHILLMSRMVLVINRLDRKLRDATHIALLQFLGMRDGKLDSEKSLYPWDLIELRNQVLTDLKPKPQVEQTGIKKPSVFSSVSSTNTSIQPP